MKKLLEWLYHIASATPKSTFVMSDSGDQVDKPWESPVRRDHDKGLSESEAFLLDDGTKPIADISITGCLQNEAMLYDEDD